MDHVRTSGNEPSSVILCQTEKYQKLTIDAPNVTGVKPLIVTAVTINPRWRTPKKAKSIFCFIDFIVVIIKILSMKE